MNVGVEQIKCVDMMMRIIIEKQMRDDIDDTTTHNNNTLKNKGETSENKVLFQKILKQRQKCQCNRCKMMRSVCSHIRKDVCRSTQQQEKE